MEKVDDETIKKIYDLYSKYGNMARVAEELKISSTTVQRYLNQKEAENIKNEQQVEATPVDEPKNAITVEKPKKAITVENPVLTPVVERPYPEMPTPEEWLKKFLQSYNLKDPFIQIQINRVMRRKELPHPSDLMTDMSQMDSGLKNNLLTVRYVIDDYDYALREYLKTREEIINTPYRRMGIPYDQRRDGGSGRGYPPHDPYNYYQRDRGDPYQDPYYQEHHGIPIHREPYPQTPYQYPYPYQPQTPYPTLEQELERMARIQALLGKTEEKNPLAERYEQELSETKARLERMEEQRQQDIMNELNQLRIQYQSEHNKRAELEDSMRKMEFQNASKSLSETDLKFQELKDRHDLEMRKLDDKSKTRDVVAKAVTTGFSQIGQAIFRTAQELGSDEKHEMTGVTDDRHMWQAPCPYCGTQITAPLSAKQIMCPGCGRKLEISQPQQQPIQQTPTPIIPPRITQPPIQEPPMEETPEIKTEEKWAVATCPYCKGRMSVPPGAKIVACPHCKKRLQIKHKPLEEKPPEPPPELPQPPEPEEPEETAGFTVEQPNLPPLEKTTYIPPMQTETPEEKPLEQPIEKPPEPEKPLEEVKEKPPLYVPPKKNKKTKKQIKKTPPPKPEKTKKEEKIKQSFECEYCDKTFDKYEKLRGHTLTHLRLKHKKKEEKNG